MSDKKICPVMAKGWLSNYHALCGSRFGTATKYNNLPKCFEENCAFWVIAHNLTTAHCGLIKGENKNE